MEQQLKFGDPVRWQGRDATVVGVRGNSLDLALFQEVKNGAGQVQNVVGTARQSELVRFEHDVPAEQVERSEDWFFSLDKDSINGLLKEWTRRQHEKEQAAQAVAAEGEKKALLDGVKIRPSARVLEVAEKLWKDAIRAEAHADEHEEIVVPAFDAKPDLWAPWIEKAKGFVAKEEQPQVQTAPAASSTENPNPGQGNQGGSSSVN